MLKVTVTLALDELSEDTREHDEVIRTGIYGGMYFVAQEKRTHRYPVDKIVSAVEEEKA